MIDIASSLLILREGFHGAASCGETCLLEWQAEQEFPILPHPDDPDCGNLYRSLKFPDAIYDHISHYQEQRANAE